MSESNSATPSDTRARTSGPAASSGGTTGPHSGGAGGGGGGASGGGASGGGASGGGGGPDPNLTAEARLAALNLELKRSQHETELANARQARLADEVTTFTTMLGQVKTFESTYGRAQEQALVKKLHQPYAERIDEAKAVLKDKHHGSLDKIDEIIKAFPKKISHLEGEVTKAENALAEKKQAYDDSVAEAADRQAKLNTTMNTQATYEQMVTQGLAIGDQVNQFEQTGDYAGMYLYARHWEETMKDHHPPEPKKAAAELNAALIAVDEANKNVRKTKEAFDEATTNLSAAQSKLADTQTNKLTLLLAEIHDKIPATKPSA